MGFMSWATKAFHTTTMRKQARSVIPTLQPEKGNKSKVWIIAYILAYSRCSSAFPSPLTSAPPPHQHSPSHETNRHLSSPQEAKRVKSIDSSRQDRCFSVFFGLRREYGSKPHIHTHSTPLFESNNIELWCLPPPKASD